MLRVEARYTDNHDFRVLETDEAVCAYVVAADVSRPRVGGGGRLYLAVHAGCFGVVERFLGRRAAAGDGKEEESKEEEGVVKDVLGLWEVLARRVPGQLPFPSAYIVPEPHGYFGGRAARNVEWEMGDDPECGEVGGILFLTRPTARITTFIRIFELTSP